LLSNVPSPELLFRKYPAASDADASAGSRGLRKRQPTQLILLSGFCRIREQPATSRSAPPRPSSTHLRGRIMALLRPVICGMQATPTTRQQSWPLPMRNN
jgi:hypothetical protein